MSTGVDEWGVPSQMFGAIGNDFYGLVGRIALVSALLEDRLYVLYGQLALAAAGGQNLPAHILKLDRLAGAPGTQVIKECHNLHHQFRPDYEDQAETFLNEATAALQNRHEIIHSLWPFSRKEQIRGWRHVHPNRRKQPNQAIEWTSLTADQLPELLREMLRLVAQSAQVEGWVRLY